MPLTVMGELDLKVVFPGLCCDMLFVVANIGSDGLLGKEASSQLGGGGGVLNKLQHGRKVVIAFASRSLRLSQRRYCTTCREMLAAVMMCTHFRSYLRGAQFTLRTVHNSL